MIVDGRTVSNRAVVKENATVADIKKLAENVSGSITYVLHNLGDGDESLHATLLPAAGSARDEATSDALARDPRFSE